MDYRGSSAIARFSLWVDGGEGGGKRSSPKLFLLVPKGNVPHPENMVRKAFVEGWVKEPIFDFAECLSVQSGSVKHYTGVTSTEWSESVSTGDYWAESIWEWHSPILRSAMAYFCDNRSAHPGDKQHRAQGGHLQPFPLTALGCISRMIEEGLQRQEQRLETAFRKSKHLSKSFKNPLNG